MAEKEKETEGARLVGRVRGMVVGGLEFSADFEGGNLKRVEPDGDGAFLLWTRADVEREATPAGDYFNMRRSWFHFRVAGGQAGRRVLLQFRDQCNLYPLFSRGFRPVWRPVGAGQAAWQRLPSPVAQVPQAAPKQAAPGGGGGLEWHNVPFTYGLDFVFPDGVSAVEFAFTFPFPLSHQLERIHHWAAHPHVAVSELAHSLQGRPVHLLTVEAPPAADPAAPPRRTIIVTGRVHPQETPSSFAVERILALLLLEPASPLAATLLSHFRFLLVPMLNPDGVASGATRSDSQGHNLNRWYNEPGDAHPVCAALRTLVGRERGRLAFYFDLHAHTSKRGVFLHGNPCGTERAVQAQSLFARVCAANHEFLTLEACDFSVSGTRHMDWSDRRSVEGSARVALSSLAPDCGHFYTVEVNYNTGRGPGNALPPGEGQPACVSPAAAEGAPCSEGGDVLFGLEDWSAVGDMLLRAVADFTEAGSWQGSRLPGQADLLEEVRELMMINQNE